MSVWTTISKESAARWLGSALVPEGAEVTSARGKLADDDEALVVVIDLSNGQRLTWRRKKKGFSLTFSQAMKEPT